MEPDTTFRSLARLPARRIAAMLAPKDGARRVMKRHSLGLEFGPNIRLALVLIAVGGFFTWIFS